MSSDSRDIDRLLAAIEAHERFVADHGRCSVSAFLAAHEQLRDLLEPLLARTQPAVKPSAASARVLGDFRLLGELGRGGMGVVYDAEQISLGRRVAVKVLPGRLMHDSGARARFARESRLAASLDHPGIAKVISASANDDEVWFAMERIDGAPLDRVLIRTAATAVANMTGGFLESVVNAVARQHGLSCDRPTHAPAANAIRSESAVWHTDYVDTVVRIGVQLAEALQHAHNHGVIHRDVKPANVLLRRDGSAVLTDFGLARELDSPSLTLTGDTFGTPSYSAPEQLSGDRAAVDHRADLFALGVSLYELLTHQRPFAASTVEEVRTRILTAEPARPRRYNSRITKDLNSVILKALEKEPSQRYQTAAALADDLRAVAEGRPVRARPARVHTRAWRWCRRHPWPATALALLLGVIVLLLAMGAQIVHAKEEQIRRTIQAGWSLAREQDMNEALTVLMPLERQFPGPASRAVLEEIFRHHSCLASYLLVSHPRERVHRAVFSADGQWVATSHAIPDESDSEQWRLQVWRMPTPDVQMPQPLPRWDSGPVPAESTMVFLGGESTIAWINDDKNTVSVGGPDRQHSAIDISATVLRILPASRPGHFGVVLEASVQLRDANETVVHTWSTASNSEDRSGVILDDLLVWAQRDSSSAWSVLPHVSSAVPIDLGNGSVHFVFDPDDLTRMVVTTDSRVTALRSRNGQLERTGSQENWLPKGVMRSRLGNEDEPSFECFNELALGGWNSRKRFFEACADPWREPYIVAIEDQVLRLWGVPEPSRFGAAAPGLEIASFEPDGLRLWCAGAETLASRSIDAAGVASWETVDMTNKARNAENEGLARSFCGIAFDPGVAVLTCSRFEPGRIGEQGWVVVLPADGLQGTDATSYECSSVPNWVELSPNRRKIAVAERNEVELLEYDPKRRTVSLLELLPGDKDRRDRLTCVRYLNERFLLASAFARRVGILCWDLNSLDPQPVPVVQHRVTHLGADQALRCLDVSKDAPMVAAGGEDCVVSVFQIDWHAGQPVLVPVWERRHSAPVFAVKFAIHDGALILASADRRGEIRLWDAETGETRGLLREGSEISGEMVLSLDFSRDGRHLAAAQKGGRVLLWDMDRPLRCLNGNRECADLLRRLQDDAR